MADKFVDLNGLRHYNGRLLEVIQQEIIPQFVADASDAAPLAPAATASAGSSEDYARADHVHPLQTSVSGNAGTATQFASNKTVQLTGDVTGSASSKGGWTVATTLANSGVTASTYGSTTQQTPAHGATFSIPYVTVDAKGRVTAAGTSTVQLPSDSNTDTLVTQNVSTANEEHPILLTATKDAAANQGAKTSIFAAAVKVNPSTGTVSATNVDVGTLHYLGERSFTIGTAGSGAGTYLQINSLVDSKSVTIANQGTNNITLTSKGNITASGTITGNKIVGDGSGLTNLDASKISSGTIDIARLPAGALERLVTVANESARFALTSSDVQLGDTVKQNDTGVMYYVVDTSSLNTSAGYVEYMAGTATSVPWSGITGKPTTIAGYGITDAKIVSGTITLGSATITPLTASSTLDASKLSGTASVSTTGNAATVTGTAGTSTLAWNSEVSLYTVGGHEIKAKLPANPNTDTKVKQYVGNTSTERPILSRYTVTDASQTANYVVYDTGVTNNPANHTITASGGFIGNATTSTQTKGVFLVIPNETTQTATLTATVTGITEYFDGLMVAYRAPFNTAASSTLNINSLGAKPIYYGVNTTSKDYYPANRLILLVYETTTTSTGCWKMVYSYDSNSNSYDRRLHNQAVKAATAVTSGTVIVGTSAGYKTAASGVTFDISYPILYASAAIAANATVTSTYEAIPSVNLQTTKASWTGTQYSTVYLVGALSGTTFTIDSSIFTTTVPSSADGKVYIPIGVLYSTYQVYFAPTRDIYQYTNGSFHPYDTTTAAAGSTNGAVKINGTDVTVYTHPTTSGNKHIPSGGSSGQFLKWSADGTAVWAADNNTWTAMTGATSSANGTVGYINAAPPSDGYNTKFWRADGSWQVPYTHPTTSGNKHIPSGGSSGQFLKWSADGTAVWAADNNSTTHLYAGASTTATANATSATTNAATYIVVCDDSAARNAVQVTGTNGTTVSAVNGKITIDSPTLSPVTTAQIDTLFA